MIELTAEMRAAAARRMGVDELDLWTEAALVDVLTIAARDRCLAPAGHVYHPLAEPTVKAKWVCRKCGGPLNQCETCKEPAQCGEAWCADPEPVKHEPLGDGARWNPANDEYDAECTCGETFSAWGCEAAEESLLSHIGRQS